MGIVGNMALAGNTDKEKLENLCNKTHKEQVEWFLNAYWGEYGEANAEKMWTWKLKCDELDLQNHENGNALDELNAHRFLEHFNEPMTVREMRDSLRSGGAIEGNMRHVPITHIIVFKYKLDWKELVNRSIANQAELAKAQKMLEEVTALFKKLKSVLTKQEHSKLLLKQLKKKSKQHLLKYTSKKLSTMERLLMQKEEVKLVVLFKRIRQKLS